ncbi:OLC1v1030098C1 [Oldenlandia corymbosa var. corymbosa]|uniref:OLC1v1030098C1 n=1 Tax=Oldenlandia corymbosa var. corymbosa TaxID=529605 RepID=A0AAV1CH61_OLDCO|nr:OLC1v1030098C1 [Oldenlandia corymbosa var. corymbosa]
MQAASEDARVYNDNIIEDLLDEAKMQIAECLVSILKVGLGFVGMLPGKSLMRFKSVSSENAKVENRLSFRLNTAEFFPISFRHTEEKFELLPAPDQMKHSDHSPLVFLTEIEGNFTLAIQWNVVSSQVTLWRLMDRQGQVWEKSQIRLPRYSLVDQKIGSVPGSTCCSTDKNCGRLSVLVCPRFG